MIGVSIRLEQLLFAIGASMFWAHLLDDTYFARQPGADTVSLLVFGGIYVAIAALFPHLGRWRAIPALLFGGLAFTGALTEHLVPLIRDGATPGDWSGSFIGFPGGVLMIATGVSVLASVASARRKHIAIRSA